MKKSLFSNLYKYRQKEGKDASENFLTELFAYVLQNDEDFQFAFFQILLKDNKKFDLDFEKKYVIKVSSQNKYPIPNETSKFIQPDIEIEFFDDNKLIALFFIENKIDSHLGNRKDEVNNDTNQLINYEKVLICKSKDEAKNIYLIYLTKYFEDISSKFDPSKKYFKQITWNEVFQHTLSKREFQDKNSISSQFKLYLTELGMNNTNSFNTRDIAIFQDFFNSTYSKMIGILEYVKTQMEIIKFGSIKIHPWAIESIGKNDNKEFKIGFWIGNEGEDNATFYFIYQNNDLKDKVGEKIKTLNEENGYENEIKGWNKVNEEDNKIQKYILLKNLFSKKDDHNIVIAEFCKKAFEEIKPF